MTSTETAASEMTPPAVSGTLVRLSGTARFFAVTSDALARLAARRAGSAGTAVALDASRARVSNPPRTLAPRRRTGARLRLRRSRSRRESVGAPLRAPNDAFRGRFGAGSRRRPVRPAGLRPAPRRGSHRSRGVAMATPPASAAPPAPERASPARDAAPSGARATPRPPPTRRPRRRRRAPGADARGGDERPTSSAASASARASSDAEDEARRDAAAKRLAAKRGGEGGGGAHRGVARGGSPRREARQAEAGAAGRRSPPSPGRTRSPTRAPTRETPPAVRTRSRPSRRRRRPPPIAPRTSSTRTATSSSARRVGRRSAPGASPGDELKSDPVPPPPPPEPTEAFEAPVESAAGVPCFGCHACGYRRQVRRVPERAQGAVRVRTAAADHQNVPSAPTYRPTEEWAGDPLAYINSIRPEAESTACATSSRRTAGSRSSGSRASTACGSAPACKP